MATASSGVRSSLRGSRPLPAGGLFCPRGSVRVLKTLHTRPGVKPSNRNLIVCGAGRVAALEVYAMEGIEA